MRVRVLGPIELGFDTARPGPRDRAVLGALVVRLGEAVSADALADALWPERPPASWAKVVQGCVSRLRRTMGADVIETSPGGYRLVPDRIDLDRVEFEELIRGGRQLVSVDSPRRAVDLLARALELWRGTPFEDLEEWLPSRLERDRLVELRRSAQEDLLFARLEAGEHREVAVDGTVLVGEEPWRERRWAILALAQYRSGQQAEALGSIRKARRVLGADLGLDPGSELVELERAILAQDPSLAPDPAIGLDSRCPWKGLASYDAEDADNFFGRRSDVELCLAQLDDRRVLVLAGPSGSGKSSLLSAGLAPALERRGLRVVRFVPGADAAAAMALARASVPGDPVLLVDQFEEAFSRAPDQTRARSWLADLAAYAVDRAPVVVTLSAEGLAELTIDSRFARLAEQGMHLVAPLTGTELREVIEEPARLAGLRLEHGLVDLLLRDAEHQPGAMPLLSHALTETWQRREGDLVTVAGYRESGGISGAVAASAERLHESLNAGERSTLRWLILRMAALTESGEPVRSTMPREVVLADPERSRVMTLLVRSRLVTAGATSYELAHGALIRAWPRLRAWLDEDTAGQRIWRHLSTAAVGWKSLGKPDSELYQGARLQAALQWQDRAGSQLTDLESEFLDASRGRVDAEQAELAQQARHERVQNRRLRGLVVGGAVLLVMSLAAGLLALNGSRTASRERDSALDAESSAQHESLVNRSISTQASSRAVAALLAVEAFHNRPDALSQAALLSTFTDAPGFLGYRTTPYEFVQGDTIPGTHRAVIGSGNHLHVVDLSTGQLGPEFEHPVRDNTNQSLLRVSGDGTRVAQVLFDPDRRSECGDYDALLVRNGRGCTLLTIFDVQTGSRVLGPLVTPFTVGDVALDRTGQVVAITGGLDGDLATYDVDSGRVLGRLAGLPRPDGVFNWRDTGALVAAGGGRVYLGSLRGPVREVDIRTLRVVRTIVLPRMSSHNYLALTPDGTLVTAGDEALAAVDVDTGDRLWGVDLSDDPDDFPCMSFAVAAPMRRVYCGSAFGEVEERDLATGLPTGLRLDAQLGELGDFAVSNGNELVAFSRGYYRWRLDGSGPVSHLAAPGKVAVGGYDDAGRVLPMAPRGARTPYSVVDVGSGRTSLRLGRNVWPGWVADETLLVYRTRRRADLHDLDTQRTWAAGRVVATSESGHPAGDDTAAWLVVPSSAPDRWDLAEVDLGNGEVRRRIPVSGYPYDVAPSADGSRLWVTLSTYQRGDHLSWADEAASNLVLLDADTGESLARVEGVNVAAVSVAGGEERVVGSTWAGSIVELDASTLTTVATLAGSKGSLEQLEFSRDGTRLLATGNDGTVQIYATEGWARVGVIPSDAPPGMFEGWLRPDGRAVAVNGRYGVVEWTLDPDRLAAAACELAGRNMSRPEWSTYMPEEPYRQTCPGYPGGA